MVQTRYHDADYAGDRVRRKYTTSYVFKLGTAVVSWRHVLQPMIALSTREAKIIAKVGVVKEAKYLRGLPRYLGVPQSVSRVICESQSDIQPVEHQAYSSKMKHIEIRDFFLEEMKVIELLKVPTIENLADIITKHVLAIKLKTCLFMICLMS